MKDILSYLRREGNRQCSLEMREKNSPKICLCPAHPVVCHSPQQKQNHERKNTQKSEFVSDAARRRPGSTSWGKMQEEGRGGDGNQDQKADPAGSLYRFPCLSFSSSDCRQTIPEAGTDLQCHLKKGPRSQRKRAYSMEPPKRLPHATELLF